MRAKKPKQTLDEEGERTWAEGGRWQKEVFEMFKKMGPDAARARFEEIAGSEGRCRTLVFDLMAVALRCQVATDESGREAAFSTIKRVSWLRALGKEQSAKNKNGHGQQTGADSGL